MHRADRIVMAPTRYAVNHDLTGFDRTVERLDGLHDRRLRQSSRKDCADKVEPRHRYHYVDGYDAVFNSLRAGFIVHDISQHRVAIPELRTRFSHGQCDVQTRHCLEGLCRIGNVLAVFISRTRPCAFKSKRLQATRPLKDFDLGWFSRLEDRQYRCSAFYQLSRPINKHLSAPALDVTSP